MKSATITQIVLFLVLGSSIYLIVSVEDIKQDVYLKNNLLNASNAGYEVLSSKYDSLKQEIETSIDSTKKWRAGYDSMLRVQKTTISKAGIAVDRKREAEKRKDTTGILTACDTLENVVQQLVAEAYVKDSMANLTIVGHEKTERDLRVSLEVKEIETAMLRSDKAGLLSVVNDMDKKLSEKDKKLMKKTGWNGVWKGSTVLLFLLLLIQTFAGG